MSQQPTTPANGDLQNGNTNSGSIDNGNTNNGSTDNGHSHTVTAARTLQASIDDIWLAWSEPIRLSHWFTSDAEHDFRVGGRYRNSDGDEGVYLDIVPQRRIVFTWEQPDYSPGSVVAVDIIPEESTGKVVVAIEHDRVACDDTEDLEIGWSWALDSLGRYLDTGLGIPFEEWAAMRGLG